MRNALAFLFGLTLCGCCNGRAFRIMSYNIRHGENMEHRLDIEGTARRIAGESPRFAGLQEVDMRTSRVNGADTCAILERETGLHATFAKAIDFGGGEYGNALLSREVPKAVRRIPLPGAEPRVLLLCEFEDCWVGVVHLAVDSSAMRLASVPVVKEAIADCGNKPAFLMGDWNDCPNSAALTALREFMTVVSDESDATYHNGNTSAAYLANPENCIDYISVSTARRGEYVFSNAHTIPDYRTSDHAPVVVDVQTR